MKTNLNLNEIDVDLTFLFHEKKDDCNRCIYWHEPFKESNEELPCCEKDTEKSKAYLLGYESKCSDRRLKKLSFFLDGAVGSLLS